MMVRNIHMTPEEIYSLWHKHIFKAQGKNVRRVQNFDKARQKGILLG